MLAPPKATRHHVRKWQPQAEPGGAGASVLWGNGSSVEREAATFIHPLREILPRHGFSQVCSRLGDIKGAGIWLFVWRPRGSQRLHLDITQRHKASMARISKCTCFFWLTSVC
jgi:hypothetical protein